MEYVLHIERSAFFAKIIKKIVEGRGYSVLHAQSGDEAYTLLEENDIGLIITGLELADAQGSLFIEKLSRSSFSSIPVIVFTSKDSLKLREQLFSLGIADYILKEDITANRLQVYFDALMGQNRVLEQIRKVPIAVLDDSRLGLTVIKNIFTLNKISTVSYFTEPGDLLKVVEQFSIFFVDMVLPGISGEEVIMRIRERNKDSVIIVVSGISNIKLVSHALMYGADDYITKPFANTIFMARLKANARSYFLNKQLQRQAVTDGLTNLYNHRYIYSAVDTWIRKQQEEGAPFCVLLMDIDFFKKVNDTYGHPVGDLVLRTVAGVFRTAFTSHAVTGRYGGEEFLIIFPDTGCTEGVRYAEAVRKRIEETVFSEYPQLTVTISGGITEYHGGDAGSVIKEADELLYEAKKSGRNRITSRTAVS